jgi:hypothetical protein
MRYKVRAADDRTYEELRSLLEKHGAPLFVASRRRRLLSTGDLSRTARDEIRARGGEVVEDRQYDPG